VAGDYNTFGEVRARLDEIVSEVRKKDLSLEKSLDLYEEAIKLGNRCAELVDKPDYSDEEARAAQEILSGDDAGQPGDNTPEQGESAQGSEDSGVTDTHAV